MQLQFTIGQNEFVEFFGVFQDNSHIWVTCVFSTICVCTTAFKVRIPPLNHCFQQSRVQITFIMPLLCSSSIFPIRKQCFINTQNSDFSLLKICNSSVTQIRVICKLNILKAQSLNTSFESDKFTSVLQSRE